MIPMLIKPIFHQFQNVLFTSTSHVLVTCIIYVYCHTITCLLCRNLEMVRNMRFTENLLATCFSQNTN